MRSIYFIIIIIYRMIITGTLIQIVDNVHIIVEDNEKNKYYIGINNLIHDIYVGKKFTCDLIPRYSVSKIIKNKFGKYKFLFSKRLIGKNDAESEIILF